jgi:branched-chain amino acid aminotransferase
MANAENSILTFVLDGDDLVPTAYTAGSLAEAVAYEPAGVYTVARTFHGDRALLLDAHLDRLEQSARFVGLPVALDRVRLRAALRDLLHRASYPDSKFRITIPHEQPEHIFLAVGPYEPVPEAVQRDGAHVITVSLERVNPVAKTTAWMSIRQPAYDSLTPGGYEGIITTPDGVLLEGMSSNFYAVLDGVLRTAGDGVLEGITRRAIYEIVRGVLRLQPDALCRADIPRLSEAMLTSSGRGVVPITAIDGQPVGDGCVGPVVMELRARYAAWAEAHLEPI